MWYEVPDYKYIEANELGEIRNPHTGKPRKKTLHRMHKGRPALREVVSGCKCTSDGKLRNLLVSRAVLSAKVGRVLETWEQACHKDGDRLNNRMDNLKVGDGVNNMIDELEIGRQHTSREMILKAIRRLDALLDTDKYS